MKLFGVVGWKNNGKTGLMERLVAEFTARGLAVSTVKHAHHGFDVDRAGTDSHRHRNAGAEEVLLSSANRWALMVESRAGEPTLAEMLTRLKPVDLVLVEGYKRDTHPKIEAHRREIGRALIARDDDTVVAVAANVAISGLRQPVFELDDTVAIADFIAAHIGLRR